MEWIRSHFYSHCYFTRLNFKRKSPFYFCLPALLGIHGTPKQKDFLRSSKGFFRAVLTGHGHTGHAWKIVKMALFESFLLVFYLVKYQCLVFSQITHYCVILAQLKYKAASCSQWHARPSAEGRGPEPQKGKGSNRNFVFVETLISLSFNTPMSDFRYLFSCPCHSRVKEKTKIKTDRLPAYLCCI